MNQDDIIRMAREIGMSPSAEGLYWTATLSDLEKFAAAEREACAKVCDSSIHDTYIQGDTGAKHSARRECAAAIRARGQA